jgi:hypothetical protein
MISCYIFNVTRFDKVCFYENINELNKYPHNGFFFTSFPFHLVPLNLTFRYMNNIQELLKSRTLSFPQMPSFNEIFYIRNFEN